MKSPKQLIVNADDFGFTRDVNEGILAAHVGGIVTATTLMATGAAFDHAVQVALGHPTLDVGCHLQLVGGRSALGPHTPMPPTLAGFLRAVTGKQIDLVAELRAQVRKILDAGIEPTHLDTHKHTHMLPQVADAVGLISEEFGIRWVRRPLSFPLIGAWIGRLFQRHDCRMTDHFEGYGLTGKLDAATLLALIDRLRPGLTELMCHPGHLGEDLAAAPTRLKESRERELQALVLPGMRGAILDAGIELVNYRGLG